MIVGIDEVGRGCWAGPLVAGAVVLDAPILGLNDSKLLSKKRRELLSKQIISTAASFGLGWVSPEEIDNVGLTRAVALAMERALGQITVDFDELIVDGNINFFPAEPRAKAIIKADMTVAEVSAASIIAKVARDNWMASVANTEYPDYHFDKHVGYGTALHINMLKKHGVTPIHRRSFKPVANIISSFERMS